MQRNAFTKFILSLFLAQGVIAASSDAAPFNSDYADYADYSACCCSGADRCSGWYIGEYIGTALVHSKFKTSVSGGTYFTSPINIESVSESGSGGLNPHDFTGQTIWGLQGGYNWARSNFIYGLATDFGFANVSGSRESSRVYPTFLASYTVKTAINTNWLWTTRARFGMQYCLGWPFIIYGTGGFALASIRVSNSFHDTAASAGHGSSSKKKEQLGWIAGAGIEVPLFANFTANGEYLFTKFNDISTNTTIRGEGEFGAGLSSPFRTRANLSASIIRLGVNYNF